MQRSPLVVESTGPLLEGLHRSHGDAVRVDGVDAKLVATAAQAEGRVKVLSRGAHVADFRPLRPEFQP